MKKNILKYIILPCVSMALVILFFPILAFADASYVDFGEECFSGPWTWDYTNHASSDRFLFDGEARGFFWKQNNSDYGGYIIVKSSTGGHVTVNYNSSCPSTATNSMTPVPNHSGYYYYTANCAGGSRSCFFQYNDVYSMPTLNMDMGASAVQYAYDHTWGDSAVDPGPSYGNVSGVSFATDITGSGDASIYNLDKIQWNTLVDSIGNDLPENATVTIRAVPGQYTGTSKENLLTKLYSNFVLDSLNATELVTISASAGWYQTTWQSVISRFTWPFATVQSCLQGESYWYKNGWVYQIRLNIDDYSSEWQTIYNITSSGVENSENIINGTSITSISETVQNINNINQTSNNNYITNNENNTNNYYYYGSPVNPDYSGNDVSGLFPSISEILNAIRNLPHTIGELLHNLFDDLFEIDWEYDDFEQQKQYVIENSGAFGQCIGHLDDLKTLIMSYNTASGVALIQWGDIVIDETVIIPAGVFNLGSIVAEDPMRSFYTLYQSLFSGFLYTLTFIKLYREALKALRQ